MRTTVTLVCVASVALALSVGAAASAAPPASVRTTACHLGLSADQRDATFDAYMHAVPGTSGMQVHFTLFQRTPGSRPTVVATPELDQWRASQTGVGSYSYAQTVNGLQAGSYYTVSVAFRWLDSRGRVIARASHRSRPCDQVGPLAELRLAGLGGAAGSTPSSELYAFDLYNGSAAGEPLATVSLYVDHALASRTPLGRLRPGQSRRFSLPGPVCQHRIRLAVTRVAGRRQTTSEVAQCPSTS